jgi:hypothetical protein
VTVDIEIDNKMLTFASNHSCGVIILRKTEVSNLGQFLSTSNQLLVSIAVPLPVPLLTTTGDEGTGLYEGYESSATIGSCLADAAAATHASAVQVRRIVMMILVKQVMMVDEIADDEKRKSLFLYC